MELQGKIAKRDIKYSSSCAQDYRDLVDKLLQVEPSLRLPLDQVFNHPWILRYRPKPAKILPKLVEVILKPDVT